MQKKDSILNNLKLDVPEGVKPLGLTESFRQFCALVISLAKFSKCKLFFDTPCRWLAANQFIRIHQK